ncbi:hypothetical protein KAJ41_00915 [Candidatus Parcubacteria bacterium]|nr:hypothetical protein [Candidatus Parcubacteria bacterium]
MKKTKNIISASDELCFWSCDGLVLRNLEDLKKSLMRMSKKTFEYHVNREKNDFATWIDNVLGDRVLANKLKKIKTIKTTIKTIENNLNK